MDAQQTSQHAVEIVADLLARSGSGQVRSTDATAATLHQYLGDQLRRTPQGGYALDQVTRAPYDPQARQAAAATLAGALGYDPAALGWVAQQVTAVHQQWASEQAGYAAPAPGYVTPAGGYPVGTPEPWRSRGPLVGGLIALAVVVVLGVSITAVYFASRATFADLLVGHWSCTDRDSSGDTHPFAVDITKSTFVFSDSSGDSGEQLTGAWRIDGTRLVITPDYPADLTDPPGDVTVDGVPSGTSDGTHTLRGSIQDQHQDVHATVSDSGRTVTLVIDQDTVVCHKS